MIYQVNSIVYSIILFVNSSYPDLIDGESLPHRQMGLIAGAAAPEGLTSSVGEGSVRSVLEAFVAIGVIALAARGVKPVASCLLGDQLPGSPPGGTERALLALGSRSRRAREWSQSY